MQSESETALGSLSATALRADGPAVRCEVVVGSGLPVPLGHSGVRGQTGPTHYENHRMVTAFHLLLVAFAIWAGAAPRLPAGARMPTPAVHRGAALSGLAPRVALPGFAPTWLAQAEGASASPRDDAAESATQAPIGRFLRTLRRAIPWLAGLFLLAGLAVVVATCWLRKGVLLQHLSTGRGRIGAGKPKVDQRVAANYLARMEKRHAEQREKERGGAGRAPGSPASRPAPEGDPRPPDAGPTRDANR
jgi:hypothetical protein